MSETVYEEVSYGPSIYVWCKGSSSRLGRHPIFVSSPVKFTRDESGRHTVLHCHHETCSLCGKPTRYEENEIGFQAGYVRPKSGEQEIACLCTQLEERAMCGSAGRRVAQGNKQDEGTDRLVRCGMAGL
jgi:hypothetical protein